MKKEQMNTTNVKKSNGGFVQRKGGAVMLTILTLFFLISPWVNAQVMESSNYQLLNDSINFGGGRSESSSYISESTFGEVGTGSSTASSYRLRTGFQQQETLDTQAPTTPAGLAATALSTSAIDLSWTASSDNIGVAGYQVFRDGTAIATTTSTSYSDTGLSASTLYTYIVQAFDTSFNYSGTSTAASATTLGADAEVDQGDGGGGSGGGSSPYPAPEFVEVQILLDTVSAKINWETDVPVKTTLRWGTTAQYELGEYQEETFSVPHTYTLTDLDPETEYVFALYIITEQGSTRELLGQRFKTLALPDVEPPVTVIEFDGTAEDEGVELEWENPVDEDFEEVRIVRSPIFYPADIFDGEVVYEGPRMNAFDPTATDEGQTYYYTLFTRDKNGNYSSGAITKVYVPFKDVGGVPEPGKGPFDGIPDAVEIPEAFEGLTLLDFDFIQNGRRVPRTKDFIAPIDGNVPLTITLDYDKVPEVLKTIGISLRHPDNPNKVFSFLLRVNSDRTAYTATIAPLGEDGTYELDAVLVDYENQGLKRLDGKLRATVLAAVGNGEPRELSQLLYIYYFVRFNFWKLLILLLIVLIPLILFLRRKRRDDDEFID